MSCHVLVRSTVSSKKGHHFQPRTALEEVLVCYPRMKEQFVQLGEERMRMNEEEMNATVPLWMQKVGAELGRHGPS